MDWIEIAIKAACAIGGIILACVVTIPNLKKAIKQRKQASTEAEKAEAELAIREQIMSLVASTEANYANLDKALKNIGESAGIFKKEKVMSDVRDFCDEKHYEYDKEQVSTIIDDVVTLTKKVNA